MSESELDTILSDLLGKVSDTWTDPKGVTRITGNEMAEMLEEDVTNAKQALTELLERKVKEATDKQETFLLANKINISQLMNENEDMRKAIGTLMQYGELNNG